MSKSRYKGVHPSAQEVMLVIDKPPVDPKPSQVSNRGLP